MTFDSAAWAINGPEIGAALARRAQYAGSRQSGIVQKDDLKVHQLSTPGVGLVIDEGVGIVLNGYQNALTSGVNEAYVVNNPAAHTIAAVDMPASNPSAQSYMVAIVVGDPDFDNTNHPWMPSTGVPTGEESTYQYVRPTLIPCAAGATTLNVNYPALLLARLDVPANTTTIVDSYIHNLRKLANPRQEQEIFVSPSGTWGNASPRYIPSGSAYGDWAASDYAPSVAVPSWAKRAIVVASINGVRLADSSSNVAGGVRTQMGSVSGPATTFDIPSGTSGAQRMNLQTAGEYDMTSVAGTSITVRVEGYENIPGSPPTAKRLALQNGSQVIFDVRFFEE
jgi:hypothetical protein